jgi:hypothetical protein
MSTASYHILESFDRLPESEQQQVAAEILRRTLKRDTPQLTDDDLVATAEEIFLELDRREDNNEQKL